MDTVKEKIYDPEFIDKVEESREQYRMGEFISLEKVDIKSFWGLDELSLRHYQTSIGRYCLS